MDRPPSPDFWQQVRALIAATAELPPQQRAAFLDAHCGADSTLRTEVEAGIRGAVTTLTPSAPLTTRADQTSAWNGGADASDGLIGARLGHWMVVDVLGSGGMGTVYLGRRVAGDFDQDVAIKVLHLGVGMDQQLAARFLSERQILAQLDHPYIARLLDGGTLPGGAPYLVMELVEGERLSYYCEANDLGLAARLELMIKVCRAVQAAHRALVVHRDLKPDNILVDSHGEPKLLDFGIAKVLDAVDGVQTRADQRLLTPRYAAPEQFTGATITTATDIYALGVILYELLAGQSPYPENTGDVLSLIRVVCEIEPDPPSRRRALSTRTGSRLAGERLRGDLDAIVMKAMRKQPGDRYGSVDALIDDLQRYQRNEAVAARQGSRGYHARKFAARHKLALGLAGMLAVGVLATALTWRHQRDAVIHERDKSRQVTAFLIELFDQADPYLNLGKPPNVNDIIRLGAERLTPAEVADPDLRAELALTLSRVMHRLGAYERALAMAETAGAALNETRDVDPALQAAVLIRLGEALREKERNAEAKAALQRALDLANRSGEARIDLRATALTELGDLQRGERNYAGAVQTLQQAVADRLQLAGWPDLATAARAAGAQPQARALALSAHDLCRALVERGPAVAAEPVCAQTLALKQRAFGPEHPALAATLTQMANIRLAAGDTDASVALSRQTLDLTIKVLGPDHADVGVGHLNLGADLRAIGRFDEAEIEAREALRIFRLVRGPDHPHSLLALNNLANLMYSQARFAESLAMHRDVAVRRAKRLAADDPQLAQSHYNIGKCLYRLGELDAAIEAWQKALEIFDQSEDPAGDGLMPRLGLALIEFDRGHFDQARQQAESLRAVIQRSDDGDLGLATALFLEARARRMIDPRDAQAMARAHSAQAALVSDSSRDLIDPADLRRWIEANDGRP